MLRTASRSFIVRGKRVTHYFVMRPAVAVVAALDDAGCYLMVRQYRGALDRYVLELPAGRCEPGESPEAAARRELEEETGYRAGRLTPILSFYASPGYSDEVVHAFAARDLTLTATRFDPSEELELVRLKPADLETAVRTGQVRDGKTILTLLAEKTGLRVSPQDERRPGAPAQGD